MVYARVAYSVTRSLKPRPFIEAVQAQGAREILLGGLVFLAALGGVLLWLLTRRDGPDSATTAGELVLPGGAKSVAKPKARHLIALTPEEEKIVKEMTDKGVDWLKKTQHVDGTWAPYNGHMGSWPDGVTAMAGLTLLSCGVDAKDEAVFVEYLENVMKKRGADLVMHSATKYLGGHGDIAAGVLCGAQKTIARLGPVMRLHGATIDPFAAWLLQRGLRTLHLRLTRQVENARVVAEALASHPRVERVYWPGLASHPDHALALAQLDGPGAIVAFELPSGEAARAVYDRLQLIRRMASLGDVETMMMQPAATSHRGLSPEERAKAGIADGLLRISVGIEDPADLVEDLVQALG